MIFLKGLNQYIRNLLVRALCWRVSNMTVLNAAYFCTGWFEVADKQFKQAFIEELYRRGLLKNKSVDNCDIRLNKFTWKDIDSVAWFDGPTNIGSHEDDYIELFTGRDRFAERNTLKRKRRAAKKP